MEAMDWNDIIKKHFTELMDVVKGGIDFASKEVPLYLKELIAYEFWHAVVYAVLCAVLVAIFIKVAFHWRKLANDKSIGHSDREGYQILMTVLFIATAVPTFICVSYVDDAVKAAVAPRVIIVEKIQSLIQGAKSCPQK